MNYHLNPSVKLPSAEILKASRLGIAIELASHRSRKAKKKLQIIYNELSFIISSL